MIKKLLLSLLLALSAFAGQYVLALNWYPSVCKTSHYKACKKPLPFWQTHFTLHGLWPKGRSYCGVDARSKMLDKRGLWDRIPMKPLSPELQELLYTYMPGAVSGLHKHEWIKHGTCYSRNPEIYFLDAIALTSQLNQTRILRYFLDHRGKRVSTYAIRKKFDEEFFPGAGKRVRFVCKRGYLVEMRINLAGSITPKTPLYDLLKKARPTSQGCRRGRIAR